MTQLNFAVDPALDPKALSALFHGRKRLHIPGFLAPEGAENLLLDLKRTSEWKLVFNQGEKLFELDRDQRAALTPEQKSKLDLAVWKAAQDQFQFRFENIRVPDSHRARENSTRLLDKFASFMSSAPVLTFLRTITGLQDISYADAQATAYGPGDFLTAHDDDVSGKKRRAAYVFNLTPAWNADWGGLLMFHGEDGHIDEALVPTMNALNIFAVPQPHSVSLVAPFASVRRYSITGWLRAGVPPR